METIELDCEFCDGVGWLDRYTVPDECHICQGTGKIETEI